MSKLNQKGFTLIEGLLIIIALALIVFTGYYVWHSQSQSNKTYNSAATISQSSPAKGSTKNRSVSTADAIIYKDDTGTLYQISLLAGTTDQKALAAAIDAHCKLNDTAAMNSVGASGVADVFTNSTNIISATSANINMSCYDKNSKSVPWGDAARYRFVKQGSSWIFSSAGQGQG
jgi:Tfp pilus assembly protein PilE